MTRGRRIGNSRQIRAFANGGEEPRYSGPDRGDAAPSVGVRIYRPCIAHQPYVTFYYMVEAAGPLVDFLYPEWGNVRFAVRGSWEVEVPGLPATGPQQAALFGPTDRHSLIRTGGGMAIGFGLAPIGWHRLIGGDAGRSANRITPLAAELGIPVARLHEAVIERADQGDAAVVELLEDMVANRLATTRPPTSDVLAVDRALRLRPATVEAFAVAAGLTDRTLHRVCRRVFGFSPKRLLRRERFLDALGEARSAVGMPVNATLGEAYYDQSHFYRDFRDFMAMSPRAYFSAPRPLMAAVADAQVLAGVTLSFRIPPQPEN